MKNRMMAIAVVAVQLVLLAALLLTQNFIIAMLALLSFSVAAAIWRFGYIIKPMLTKHAIVAEGFGKYELPPAQEVIVKKHGDRYLATCYLLIRFAHSTTEKTPEQLSLMKQGYERAISSLNHVCKISNMMCPVDLTAHVDRIKESRSRAECRLSEMEALPINANVGGEIARLRREIESCTTQLERITRGERPMRMINFAMTCAGDHSMDNAIAKAKAQAAELKTVLASTLDSEVLPLSGDELKRCFEWEHMLPQDDDFMY